jgi:hypothetical protein
MAAAMPELRTPVMIFVEASWEDETGVARKTRACMEDRSAGGACIRVKTPIAIGSRVSIQWRFEQFSGVVKYCRQEGREYLVGIQRNVIEQNVIQQPVIHQSVIERNHEKNLIAPQAGTSEKDVQQKDVRPKEIQEQTSTGASSSTSEHRPDDSSKDGGGPVQNVESQPPPKTDPALRIAETDGTREPAENSESRLLLQSVNLMNLPVPRSIVPRSSPAEALHSAKSARDRPVAAAQADFEVSRQIQHIPKGNPRSTNAGREADMEKKPMANKWLAHAPWHKKDDATAAGGEEDSTREEASIPIARKEANSKETPKPALQSAQPVEKIHAISAREVPAFQVELLPMEDIYRTAGIVGPRKGYSVTKVVEMLNSEHIRGLLKETKRAAMLMALDAAGVTIEQVQRDAKARQAALDSYESEQKKQAEAEWSRKAEEISHIQAELESIKAHYTARISRNMEALARDKARFNSWITTKEQESQSMAEAVELCLTPAPESAPAPQREAAVAAVKAQ